MCHMDMTTSPVSEAIADRQLSEWERLVDEYDRMLDQLCSMYDPDADHVADQEFERIETLAGELFQKANALQPWTVFDTCVGGAAVWVQADPATAEEAFNSHCDGRAFDRCGQCGDSHWHDCSESCNLAAGPPPDATIIDAVEVAALLESVHD